MTWLRVESAMQLEEVKGERAPSLALAWAGLLIVAALSLGPLLLEARPIRFEPAQLSHGANWSARVVVLAAMMLGIGLAIRRGCEYEPSLWLVAGGMALTAALLTACHWYTVECRYAGTESQRDYFQADWQRKLYLGILNREKADLGGQAYTIPHLYRPLPYGFVRSLELATGDWWFACLSYRWFFTYWFMWGYYWFARLFLTRGLALLAVAVYPILYPLSIRYYGGQLTDPMSHALFVLGLIAIVRERWQLLAGTLVLGVLAKETTLILVPAYWACHLGQTGALLRTGLLAVGGAGSFLAARMPLGWRLGDSVNDTPWNVRWNLGIGPLPPFPESIIHQNYVQPALFVGLFLPLIALRWRWAAQPLKMLFLVLTPLLLLSSFCYGWLYESRNYVPLLPVLTTLALTPARGKA
jgi:hypothetical protein